jgi:hypothetical protein
MNSLMEQQSALLEADQELRRDLIDVLTEDDLAYKLPGNTLVLGELCREMGEIEQSYIDSFKTFKHDFSYRHNDPAVLSSVAALNAWYDTLDR